MNNKIETDECLKGRCEAGGFRAAVFLWTESDKRNDKSDTEPCGFDTDMIKKNREIVYWTYEIIYALAD